MQHLVCLYEYYRCVCVCWCLCVYVQPPRGWHDAPPCCYWIMGDISHISIIRGLYGCLYISHQHVYTSYRSISPAHTHAYTCILSLPSISERLHSPPYRLKPVLTEPAPLTHTLSRGQSTLWNNYSLNWQLISLKSIWPCRANLEIERYDSLDAEAKTWIDGGMRGEEESSREGRREMMDRCHLISLPAEKSLAVSSCLGEGRLGLWGLHICVCTVACLCETSHFCHLILPSWSFGC